MFKRYLIVKLLAVNLLVAGFAVAVVWLAIDTLAAGYFVTLMEKYHISPEPAHALFVDSVHRYLVWALAGAIALAIGLSYLINRRVLGPLTRMTANTREIAAGDFTTRIPVTTTDEVGQLAKAFNRMAENLEKIERLRRTLMIDVAHELRTPLTNIRGYLEALNDGVLQPDPETLALLQAETLRLAGLVEDVLDLARADAAGGRLNPQSLDLIQMIEEALETFSRNIAEKRLTVKVDHLPTHNGIQADPNGLTRILRNLMDNAVRYAPAKTNVTIRMAEKERNIFVDFQNEAENLSVEDIPFLFERFYRGEKSRSRNHGGAGIGLSIVKELVAAHGGTVHARLEKNRVHIGFMLPAVGENPSSTNRG